MSDARTLPLLLDGDPPEFLVHDEEEECPYLEGERARFPFRLPVRLLAPRELARRLEQGDRRNGPLLYRPTCPSCDACRPIRLDVTSFVPRERHRRVTARGRAEMRVEVGPTLCDAARVRLYNAHAFGRGLARDETPMDEDRYARFLTQTCCDSFELRYYVGERLVGVAITDRAADSLSAVYCYYDPTLPRLSIGTFSILEQLDLCRRSGLRYLYLGLYVVGSKTMAYKARFLPHEQRIDGSWRVVTELPEELG